MLSARGRNFPEPMRRWVMERTRVSRAPLRFLRMRLVAAFVWVLGAGACHETCGVDTSDSQATAETSEETSDTDGEGTCSTHKDSSCLSGVDNCGTVDCGGCGDYDENGCLRKRCPQGKCGSGEICMLIYTATGLHCMEDAGQCSCLMNPLTAEVAVCVPDTCNQAQCRPHEDSSCLFGLDCDVVDCGGCGDYDENGCLRKRCLDGKCGPDETCRDIFTTTDLHCSEDAGQCSCWADPFQAEVPVCLPRNCQP